MKLGWVLVAVGLEILSCVGYVIAFLQVFDRAPLRFGARVALSELAFGAAVSLGGAGSIAVGALAAGRAGRRADPGRRALGGAVPAHQRDQRGDARCSPASACVSGCCPGPRNPLLSLVPAAVGIVVLVVFLALPRDHRADRG